MRVYAPAPPLRKHAPGAFYLGRQSELARSRRYYKPQRVSIRRYRWVANRSNVSSGSWSSRTWPGRMRSVASGATAFQARLCRCRCRRGRHRSAFRTDHDRRGTARRDKGGFLPDRSSRPPGKPNTNKFRGFDEPSELPSGLDNGPILDSLSRMFASVNHGPDDLKRERTICGTSLCRRST